MEEESAFWCMICLIEKYSLQDAYISSEYRKKTFSCLRCVTKKELPKIHDHFMKFNIEYEIFAVEWTQIFFAKEFSVEIVMRIWDNYFLEGFSFILRSILAILKILSDQILKIKDYMEIIRFLKDKPQLIEEERLFKAIYSIRKTKEIMSFDSLGFLDRTEDEKTYVGVDLQFVI